MNEIPCPNAVRDDLKAYIDGELALSRRFAVRRHLAQCAACQQEIEELKAMSEKLKAAEGAAPLLAPALRSRILSGFEQAPPAAGSPIATSPLWRRKPLLVWGGGGAALAASALAFATVYNPAKQMAASESSANHAIGSAMRMYAQDYDEHFPGANKPALAGQVAASSDRAMQKADAESASYAPGAGAAAKSTLRARAAAPASSAPAAPMADTSTAERLVHKEASLGVSVAEIESASSKIEELVKASGGFVASNNLSTDETSGDKTADLAVRVPVADFDTMMQSFAKLGAVVSKNVTGEDVTEKTSDATSAEQVLTDEAEAAAKRLRTESMSEKRTGQKEAELRELRLRLAQTRARLGLLRKMASLSTINVSLVEKHKKAAGTTTTPSTGFFAGMQETNHAAALAFQSAVRVPLVLVIWVLAFSPIWVPLVLAYRWASLKTLAKQAVTAPPSE